MFLLLFVVFSAALQDMSFPLAAEDEDILIADFEGEGYGAWRVEGEAFGPGPARGTLPGQMEVTGFEGRGLVNTFHQGDGTQGTLTSPAFRIERRYLWFLIGGGHHPDDTCIQLLVDGRVVRTATGPNDRPGGTERLDGYTWDVAEFEGQSGMLRIIDRHRGGWGHINIDQITQSDQAKGQFETLRDLRIEHDYINFRLGPQEWPRSRVRLIVDGETVRKTIAAERRDPCWITWDVSRLRGRPGLLKIVERLDPDGKRITAESFTHGDEVKGALMVVDKLYEETYRPQFHFTARKNWLNDPNGLVHYQGEYHLFFQHNPRGIDWGNMTWGHAVSSDLIHWRQLDHAIHPDELGTIFSGSAVVDWKNTGGFQEGPEPALVAVYTSAGEPFTQSIACSSDRGRTWTKYEKNPVLGHVAGRNRDPKVLWHEPSKKWVMALYLDKNDYALFGSGDLKQWSKLCDVPMPGSTECPDFFELPVDGDPKNTRWVFWGANGRYMLGSFDGKTFAPEEGIHRTEWGANSYAAQTFSDIPALDGRRIQIAWMAGGQYPDMPFNQQMSFPRELTLRTTPDGIRLHLEPVREIERIRARKQAFTDLGLAPGKNPLSGIQGELLELRADIEPAMAAAVELSIRGMPIRYDVVKAEWTAFGKSAPLSRIEDRIKLHLLVDRTSIEIFADNGRAVISFCFLPDPEERTLAIRSEGGKAVVRSLEVYELRSIWK